MTCSTHIESTHSSYGIYNPVLLKTASYEENRISIESEFYSTSVRFSTDNVSWCEHKYTTQYHQEYVIPKTLKEKMWDELFPGEELIEPYVGAVDDYGGCLDEFLPDDFDLSEYIDID
jgi:hypothetical protein